MGEDKRDEGEPNDDVNSDDRFERHGNRDGNEQPQVHQPPPPLAPGALVPHYGSPFSHVLALHADHASRLKTTK
jgi:hypothetical protein